MTAFLAQVAAHYYGAGDIEGMCFIFPNRRAKSFFRKWLCDEVASGNGIPVIAPAMMTVNEFFYSLGSGNQTDRITLLLELYSLYSSLNPKAEPLDDFIFWGDVLLSDFDDVDKYLVDARNLFTDVSDFKNIQDSYSYLSVQQRQAIERFLSHFRGENGVGDYKRRFLQVWNILYPLYVGFNEKLLAEGLSYEGAVYRRVAERVRSEAVSDLLSEAFPESRKFVFVGLNALNECERLLLSRMKNAGLAEFCWDYSSDIIKDRANKSSFFLEKNVAEFGQAFSLDSEGLRPPEINVLSVPGGVAMAKQIPAILSRIPSDKPVGIETAVILPDEGLLLPVLNSIPSSIRELNVTMGYPMGASEFWSLMNDISSLQMHIRIKDGRCLFYHRQVWSIFSNAVFKSLLSPEAVSQVETVRKEARYYIAQDDLNGDPVLDLIFKPVVKDTRQVSADAVRKIEEYQLALITGIAPLLKDKPEMAVEMDFAMVYHLAVKRLYQYTLPILPATYFSLLAQLVGSASVPFQGEPLGGLQIMGPLETRALDFDNLIILSCNEGMFPRRSVSSSFIPPELRKGFCLPTYEYQDAVWAYYFYRLIQRASRVWLVSDSRTEGLSTGEESRYIKQLELHFGLAVKRHVLSSSISVPEEDSDIAKTGEHLERLHHSRLSASALKNYLSCPARFYYASVERLQEDEEVAEALDAGSVGNVFHKAMEELYRGRDVISRDYLDSLLSDKTGLHTLVSGLIMKQLNCFEVSGRNIIFEDVVSRYVLKVLERDRELLDSYGTDSFRVLGLELEKKMDIHGFHFLGYIDRLDSFVPDEIRVVDYKTGKVSDDDFHIDSGNAAKVVEKLFGSDDKNRPKIALQLYLYDRFISSDREYAGKKVVNSIYQTSRLFRSGVEKVELDPLFCSLMDSSLEGLLDEIGDLAVPWRRTEDLLTCSFCDFKTICGR